MVYRYSKRYSEPFRNAKDLAKSQSVILESYAGYTRLPALTHALDLDFEAGIGISPDLNGATCVNHGRMISASKTPSDGFERERRQPFSEEHGHLRRIDEGAFSTFSDQQIWIQIKARCNDLSDPARRGGFANRRVDNFVQRFLHRSEIERAVLGYNLHGQESIDGALHDANVVLHTLGHEVDDITRQVETVSFCMIQKNGDPSLKVGRLNIGRKTPSDSGE